MNLKRILKYPLAADRRRGMQITNSLKMALLTGVMVHQRPGVLDEYNPGLADNRLLAVEKLEP